jgi:GH15 family glucan-1,4-alpha-glucosidase
MAYPEIQAHGVIGNMRTAALVCNDGSVDFFCFPRFDSGSVFLSLLDQKQGGYFVISPDAHNVRTRQMYLPDSNVLVTRFMCEEGMAQITDYMPVCRDGPKSSLVRNLECVRGEMKFRMHCEPRFDYARADCVAKLSDDACKAFFDVEGNVDPMRLRSTTPMVATEGIVTAEFSLKPGESVGFVLECARERASEGDLKNFIDRSFNDTVRFWRNWSERSTYTGRWRETVQRSALILKLLTSVDHGSIVGAATFGLPEHVGGERNWDYRYCWLRDAAFAVYALMRLGYNDEADHFIRWVEAHTGNHSDHGGPDVLYAVDGARVASEIELSHLEGYRGSRPVRVGNAAAGQLQLDMLGELTDALYLADKNGRPPGIDVWRRFTQAMDWLCENWDRPEEGIWEIRGPQREFLSGRLMCWVALDRGLRMARRFARPAPTEQWSTTRDAIANQIFDEFWNPKKKAFVQCRGGEALDAVALLMPLVKFISPTDARWLSTLDAIGRELTIDALVFRYSTHDEGVNLDGLEGVEGAFTPCSFWYVECLARAGRIEQAQLLFEKTLSYANHLGLYAEELGASGDHLGNFPQAWTHLALISAAYALNNAIDTRPPDEVPR